MNTCSCVLSDNDGSIVVLSETMPKARKTHQCIECYHPIFQGSKYEQIQGVREGEVNSYKTCLSCVQVRDHFFCDSWSYGMVWEDLRNHIWDVGTEEVSNCLQGLSREGLEKVCDLIAEFWEEEEEDD